MERKGQAEREGRRREKIEVIRGGRGRGEEAGDCERLKKAA